jgi:hypothetical protein
MPNTKKNDRRTVLQQFYKTIKNKSKNKMKHKCQIFSLLLLLNTASVFSQSAPPHLKHFGYALVDMLWDDPHDTSTITNYIAEVDSFSNIAQLGVYDYADNIIVRVNLMNSKCVKPIVSLQSIFYQTIDTLAPSGNHIALFANFIARWNFFKTTNAAILDSAKVAAFYVVDEPVWNGLLFSELDTVCNLLKNDFPNIPLFFVEASTALSNLQIPTTIDWVGFDEYGIFDPYTDVTYNNNLDTLKSKRSNSNQKIILVVDDQWMPYYGVAGYSPDTIRYMVQNYYNLAASDIEIIGMIGYLWPGGLDDPGQLGVRDMPQSVINKNVEIGTMIKANYSPCSTLGINKNENASYILIYPNPFSFMTTFQTDKSLHNATFSVCNLYGQQVKQIKNISGQIVPFYRDNLPSGLYFVCLTEGNKIITVEKLIITD